MEEHTGLTNISKSRVLVNMIDEFLHYTGLELVPALQMCCQYRG